MAKAPANHHSTHTGLQFVADQEKWDQRSIPIADVREGSEALRGVDRSSPEYIELKDSIKSKGILLPILVREIKDQESGRTIFQIVDGLQRFTAMSELGAKAIPANVVDLSEGEVFEAQLIANAKRVVTKPAAFSSHMVKILGQNPMLTRAELGNKLSVSTEWINSHLNLTKLHPKIAELVDDQKIVVSNALAMSKLPQEEQIDLLDLAQTQSPSEFAARASSRLKEIREAARKGRDPSKREYTPVAVVRKPASIKSEHENAAVFREVLTKVDAKTPEDGWKAAIAWVLQVDPITIELKKREEMDREQKRAADAERRKKEKEEVAAEIARRHQSEIADGEADEANSEMAEAVA